MKWKRSKKAHKDSQDKTKKGDSDKNLTKEQPKADPIIDVEELTDDVEAQSMRTIQTTTKDGDEQDTKQVNKSDNFSDHQSSLSSRTTDDNMGRLPKSHETPKIGLPQSLHENINKRCLMAV